MPPLSLCAVVLMAALALAGCGAAPVAQGINDPEEVQNRQTHAFNKGLDRALLRPAARGYAAVVPQPVRQGVANFAGNLDLPGQVVNGVLQGRPGPAAANTARFVLNSTVGVAGIFDPARAIGLEGRPTDFGETLHVWGAEEGAYHELPVLGPSTDRDTMGRIVDLGLNPLRFIIPKDAEAVVAAGRVGAGLGARAQLGDTVDQVLYESADSYAQTRLIYLQNRRFRLGQGGAAPGAAPGAGAGAAPGAAPDDFVDPYAE